MEWIAEYIGLILTIVGSVLSVLLGWIIWSLKTGFVSKPAYNAALREQREDRDEALKELREGFDTALKEHADKVDEDFEKQGVRLGKVEQAVAAVPTRADLDKLHDEMKDQGKSIAAVIKGQEQQSELITQLLKVHIHNTQAGACPNGS
ncbi:hypothetical protein [Magnetococcus sp. PR-3]|uniref:hypothetical protein n=1 Tax=Magnetococcus sp. PR-3 TaxID=3120355 RepID=UPI002FCDECD2